MRRWQVSCSPSRVTGTTATWFAVFWGVFLSFYAGSYNYGADVRFSLMSYAPLAVLAGVGMSRLVRAAAVKIGAGPARGIAIASGSLLQFTWYLPWVRSVGEEAWAARADVEFASEVARQLPPNALVLTHNPGMFHVWGANAAQLSIAVDEAGIRARRGPAALRRRCGTFTGISGATSPIPFSNRSAIAR